MSAISYLYLYFLFVTILTIIYSRYFYSDDYLKNVPKIQTTITFFIALLIALFIGLRPESMLFGDMIGYREAYERNLGTKFYFEWDTTNIIFDNLMPLMSSMGFSSTSFFVIISIFYFILTYWGCRLLFNENSSIVYIMWLGAFSTYSYGVNGIKAGFATALFYVALGLLFKKKKLLGLLFSVLSLGVHHSMILPMLAGSITYFFKKDRVYLFIWIFSFFIAALHFTFFQHFFGGFVDEQGAKYLLYGTGHSIKTSVLNGFRIDFILYGAVPIFLGWRAKLKYHFHSDFYDFLLNTYTLCNSTWMLCMYADFTNRIAYLSWFMYPIVLAFPYFSMAWKNNQYKEIRLIIFGHLIFTLFMTFVYY